MMQKILIVEDEFIVANNLSLIVANAGYEVCGMATTVREAKLAIEKSKPDWVLLDIFLQDRSRGTDLASYLRERGISFIYISANANQSVLEKAKATQPHGFLIKPFKERDLLTMLRIAGERDSHYLEVENQTSQQLRHQIDQLIDSDHCFQEQWSQISGIFQGIIPFDLLRINLLGDKGKNSDEFAIIRTGFEQYEILKKQGLISQLGFYGQMANWFLRCLANETEEKVYGKAEYEKLILIDSCERLLSKKYKLSSKIVFTVHLDNSPQASLSFYNKESEIYSSAQLSTLKKAEKDISKLLTFINLHLFKLSVNLDENFRTGELRRPKAGQSLAGLQGLIGKSCKWLNVLDRVTMIATTESSVLITGEIGTGKELVARTIHSTSNRRFNAFIAVNCATLTKECIDYELFGVANATMEEGSKIIVSKFQQAYGGTIFLENVSELPLNAQLRLMGFLQALDLESVSNKTKNANVRIIAATDKSLEKEVAEGRFRLDLYYRLSVFVLALPALRERHGDIVRLAHFFLEKYHKLAKTTIPVLSKDAIDQLEGYDWPGNIDELENLLKKTVSLTGVEVIKRFKLP